MLFAVLGWVVSNEIPRHPRPRRGVPIGVLHPGDRAGPADAGRAVGGGRTTEAARRAGVHGWAISYEAKVIYVNLDAGEYVVLDKLTEQFAKRAFTLLQRQRPAAAKSFRTWKRFAVWLTNGVR